MFDCVNMALHVHLGGSSPYRSLKGIAHPVVGTLFRYREYAGGRRLLKAAVIKKAGLCLVINFL